MNLHEMIAHLRAELARVDAAIAAIERLQAQTPPAPSRRGRKFMAPEERAEVSRRMRAYWAARRRERGRA